MSKQTIQGKMKSFSDTCWRVIKRLEFQVVVALFLAIYVGVFFPEISSSTLNLATGEIEKTTYFHIDSIAWMWDMFMKLLKVFLWPLLFFSVFSAVLGLGDFKKLWNIWLRTMLYYMLTTTLAISVSLILMNIFEPGVGLNFGFKEFSPETIEKLTFSSFIGSLIPSNIFQAFVDLNAMQIVSTGMILWISVLAIWKNKDTEALHALIETLNTGILKFISFVIKLTPFGVFAIVAKVVYENWVESMINLLPFVAVILFALFIHAFLSLPLIGTIIGNFNPFKYFRKVKEAILVGFSTASSSATMWLSMSVAKNKAHLSKEVVDFTFPIWTTINMDGTALYQAWVAIFVAQVLWIDLTIMAQLTIVLIVILASVWAAGIPWAGILILTTVFLTIWLPVEAIWIILAVDRILDMFRTGVNVWWDLLTAKVVDKIYRKNIDTAGNKKKKKKIIIPGSEVQA